MREILLGDALEELKKLPDNSVDSIVTDPPAGISFMGKSWDDDKGGKNFWIGWLIQVMKESLRVLKPGGYGLVWALPRTSHWTATALEEAGFEIRDCIYHIFGSGFPKSLDIGKAIDKLQGNKREVVGVGASGKPESHSVMNMAYKEGSKSIMGGEYDLTKGNSQWEGFGTALKPAVECWWLIRKPLSEKTVAQNVLKWGTGGLNIDGSRVGTTTRLNGRNKESDENNSIFTGYGSQEKGEKDYGRFPSHLIHDGSPEVLAGFPNSKSSQHNGDGEPLDTRGQGWGFKRMAGGFDDSGSASRFFYCAKSSKSERDYGLEGFEKKQYIHDGREEHTETPHQRHDSVPRNHHPTVKPLALMTYLIKLITPPKGIVLDMFAGSGSTLVAAKTLGHPFIGIEKEADYIKIAEARVKAVPKTLF